MFLENLTDDGNFVFLTYKTTYQSYGEYKQASYATSVFRATRDGKANMDRCVKTLFSDSEEEAYLTHVLNWEKFNKGEYDGWYV